jgi:thiol:disulfide interchange protein DsbD
MAHRSRILASLFLMALLVLVSMAQAQFLDLGGGGNERRAKVESAINTTALRAGSDGVLAVVVDIAPGYHAQSAKPLDENLIAFKVTPGKNPAVEFKAPMYPPGKIETYTALGKLSVYDGRVIAYVPFAVQPDAPIGTVTLTGEVGYQICDDKQCFQPESRTFSVETRVAGADEEVKGNREELFAGYREPTRGSRTPPAPSPVQRPTTTATTTTTQSQTQPPAVEQERSWSAPLWFGAAFLAGLIFNLMPCVLPVMPIKAAGFYEVAQHRRSQSIILGGVFSLGVIAFFTVLAILILVLRTLTWSELFSNQWFVWAIVIVLVAMAASMFGAFTFNLPTSVYRFTPRHDTYAGNFLFGIFTAVLSTPCTAPLFPALMAWAYYQPPAIGVPAMMMVGVGMAFPYFVLSAFPGLARKFPRSGPWAELVKQMMGFLLLVAAAYFAGSITLKYPNFWWPVVAVVAVACVYLVARTVQITDRAGAVAFSSALAVALLGGALYLAVPASGILGGGAGSVQASWEPYSTETFDAARAQGKVVLVKFTANWCLNCQLIEQTVFSNADVWEAMRKRGVVALKADFTKANPEAKELLLQLNPTGGIPVTAIYAPAWGKPLVFESVYTSPTLLDALAKAAGESVAAVK